MTLVVTVNAVETIWLLADRRLSKGAQTVSDSARKVMVLETVDGVALLGYAGLGSTASGTEPAEWMSAVLRGHNTSLEQSLSILATAAQRELPPHLVSMDGQPPSHSILVLALVQNEVRLYSIDLALAKDRRQTSFRYTRHEFHSPSGAFRAAPRLACAGSGAVRFHQEKSWHRSLLKAARACDEKRISPAAVAKLLASFNLAIHLSEPTVGPRCIVIWRHRPRGPHNGGGAHQRFIADRPDDEQDLGTLPTIGTGLDISAITKILMPSFIKASNAFFNGSQPSELDRDEINIKLAALPQNPDEKLR